MVYMFYKHFSDAAHDVQSFILLVSYSFIRLFPNHLFCFERYKDVKHKRIGSSKKK